MSKLQDLCRSVKIYNDYKFFGSEPYFYYRPNGDYRSGIVSAFVVHKTGVDFGGHWTEHGNKAFMNYGKHDKQEKFELAAMFMFSEFGIEELARSPFGSWGDKEFVERRIREIKEMAK